MWAELAAALAQALATMVAAAPGSGGASGSGVPICVAGGIAAILRAAANGGGKVRIMMF